MLILNNHQTFSKKKDQWREVHDDMTGKTYFYNRHTRESRWSLPKNAILIGKKRKINGRKHHDETHNRQEEAYTLSSNELSCNNIFGKANESLSNIKEGIISPTIISCMDEEQSRAVVSRCKRQEKSLSNSTVL